ncbi:Ubiquitin-60S ribosomal protein L40 [Bonamia ostreae]|uniref:Ubiquitin-60S ribosomal protein L40 n=1 Tax=Bonamia ostreae TaxID=126728 RepID=A0ABV2AJE8_9EUKA
MLIYIKTLSGDKKEKDFDPDKQISDLKKLISETEMVSTKHIRLINSGRILKDSQTLAHYKILPGDTLHMTIHLRGG